MVCKGFFMNSLCFCDYDSCDYSSHEVLSSYFLPDPVKVSLLLGTINVNFILPID